MELINREQAIQFVTQAHSSGCVQQRIKNLLKLVPTIESRPKGKWLEHFYPYFEVPGIECSICGKDVPYWNRQYEEPNFCPNCGAKMIEVEVES